MLRKLLIGLLVVAADLSPLPSPAQERDKFEVLLEGIVPIFRSPGFMFDGLGNLCSSPKEPVCQDAHSKILAEWFSLYLALGQGLKVGNGDWPEQLTDLQRQNLKDVYGGRINALDEDIRIFENLYQK